MKLIVTPGPRKFQKLDEECEGLWISMSVDAMKNTSKMIVNIINEDRSSSLPNELDKKVTYLQNIACHINEKENIVWRLLTSNYETVRRSTLLKKYPKLSHIIMERMKKSDLPIPTKSFDIYMIYQIRDT